MSIGSGRSLFVLFNHVDGLVIVLFGRCDGLRGRDGGLSRQNGCRAGNGVGLVDWGGGGGGLSRSSSGGGAEKHGGLNRRWTGWVGSRTSHARELHAVLRLILDHIGEEFLQRLLLIQRKLGRVERGGCIQRQGRGRGREVETELQWFLLDDHRLGGRGGNGSLFECCKVGGVEVVPVEIVHWVKGERRDVC